jgi:hypothetical protein
MHDYDYNSGDDEEYYGAGTSDQCESINYDDLEHKHVPTRTKKNRSIYHEESIQEYYAAKKISC